MNKELVNQMAVSYEFAVDTDLDFEAAEGRTRELLQGEGSGVLTEIDMQATLRAKLGTELRPYKILGDCNPQLAHRALEVEPGIGLLLPCNSNRGGRCQAGQGALHGTEVGSVGGRQRGDCADCRGGVGAAPPSRRKAAPRRLRPGPSARTSQEQEGV